MVLVAKNLISLICLIAWYSSSTQVDALKDTGGAHVAPVVISRQFSDGSTPSPTFPRRTAVPTFRNPAAFRPPSSTFNDEEAPPDETATQFIVTLCVGVLIAICCGCNLGYVALAKYEDAETAAREFREEIMNRQFLVVTIPVGSIPHPLCCLANYKGERWGWDRKKYALFFTTRIKLRWKPLHTYMQFFLGWVSLVTTLIGLFDPKNTTNSIIGSASLFLGELLIHTWYGFLRYPNLATVGLGGLTDEGDDIFEEMKYLFGVLYHNGDAEDKYARWIDFACFPFVLPLHLASLFGSLATCIVCCALQDGGRNNNAGGDIGLAIIVGVMFGSFFYPLIFLLSDGAGGILLASLAHHIVSEYYEAKLFRKTGKQFLASVGFKAFSECVGVENFGIEGDGFNDAMAELNGKLDPTRLDDDSTTNDPEVGGAPNTTFDNTSSNSNANSPPDNSNQDRASGQGGNPNYKEHDGPEEGDGDTHDFDPAGVNGMSEDGDGVSEDDNDTRDAESDDDGGMDSSSTTRPRAASF